MEDSAAMCRALGEARRVFCAFVFDTGILDALEDRADRRVEFIWESVAELDAALRARGADLTVLHGPADRLIPAPDCGMKYMPRATAFGKLKALAEGAAIVRRGL